MNDDRSKYLSYILRHKPEKAKLVLDSEGWITVSELCSKTDFTPKELKEIAKADAKGRYSIEGWPEKIRANQGHTTEQVKITFKKEIPPPTLYHGTRRQHLVTITKQGLLPMKRHHVHLSGDLATANAVAKRGKTKDSDVCVLLIDTAAMLADGIEFFRSENGVWLVDHVDTKYFVVMS